MRTTARGALACLLTCAVIGACDHAPTAPADTASAASPEVMFNPQPDPPKEIAHFLIDTPELVDNPELIDNPNLRPWLGTFTDRHGREGAITVQTLLPAVRVGEVVRLVQLWDFGQDSGLPAVQVEGLLNLRSGRLALRGRVSDGGLYLVQGWFTSAGGVASIGGELMFNPQPDPPVTH